MHAEQAEQAASNRSLPLLATSVTLIVKTLLKTFLKT